MKIFIIVFILKILLLAQAPVKIYSTGEVYEFTENNALEDIQNNIKEKTPELKKELSKMQKKSKDLIKNFKPKNMIALTPAIKNHTFYPDMRYTNPENIYDNHGNIIYPKGFTFNPLDFIRTSQQYIVIDGSRDDEIKWLVDNNYTDKIKYKILISDGNYIEVRKKIKQLVFYLLPKITNKFQLKHTPSIIAQVGNKMEVKEICLKCKNRKTK